MNSNNSSLTGSLFALALAIFCCLPASAQNGGPGTAVLLNGTTNAWLNVANGTWLSGNFTVEAWVKVNSYNSWSRLIDFSDGPNTNNVYVALSDSTTGIPATGVFTNNNGSPFMEANTQLPLNQWVHLAATGNGTNGTIYLNGAPIGTGMLNIAPNVVRTDNYIGRSAYPADSYANAIFDELSIWNAARTRVQIQTGMNHPLVGNEPGLAGYWRFDEGSGTNAFDSTGNGNTATLNSGVTWTNSSAPLTNAADYALSFTGAQVVTIPHQAAQDAYPFTVMCWFMEPTNSPGNGALVGNYVSSSLNGWQLASSGGQLYAWYYRDSGGDHVGNTGAGAINDGLWHHAAFVVSSSGGVIYLDGVPKQTNAWAGTAGPCTTTEAAFLGIYQGDSLFTGDIDEVSIWNAALTPSQIQTYMHQPLQGTETGLVNYYRMNEGIGTNIYDYTTNADTGVFSTPSPAWILSGAQVQTPQVATLPATLNGTSATLSGTVNPEGLNAASWFNWGPTTSYGSVTPSNNLAATYTLSTNTSTLSGLAAGTYHFQIVATNAVGTNYGADQSFTIAAPQVATLPATLNGALATLSGTVNPEGQNAGSWFNWGLTTSYGNVTPINTFAAGYINSTNTSMLNGLLSGTYHFQIVATNAVGTSYGSDQTFTIMTQFQLGNSNVVEGPAPGEDSVVLAASPTNAGWSATANASWLHTVTPGGIGSTNVIFSFDTNSGTARSGTLTIAGQTLTVNQAGSGSVQGAFTTIIPYPTVDPNAIAADSAGDVYIANYGNSDYAVLKWNPANNAISTNIPYGAGGISYIVALAVDGAGNIFINDAVNKKFDKWTATNGVVSTLYSGMANPQGAAVDASGNAYFSDLNNFIIYEWVAASNSVKTLLSGPQAPGLSADAANNFYFYDQSANKLEERFAANGRVITLVTNTSPATGGYLAADGGGNLYIENIINGTSYTIGKWSPATGGQTTLIPSSALPGVNSLAVDGARNIYVLNGNNSIYELPDAFVNLTAQSLPPAAGSGSLPAVLPSSFNLVGPFAPASNQPWLTITGTANGVVNYSFTANTNITSRTAHIQLLGQSINISQAGMPELGTTNLPVGPGAGRGSDILVADPAAGLWNVTANAAWLHTLAGYQSGTGSTNVIFSFDANPGGVRTGTLTIANQTLTISQAPSNYVAVAGASATPALLTFGLESPWGMALDGAGNIYITDDGFEAVREWVKTNGTFITLVTNLSNPEGIAVDNKGNVYFSDSGNNAIKEWTAANGNVTTLVSSNLNTPAGVAVDSSGNVYIADEGNGAIKEWIASNGTVVPLATGLSNPYGVAVDVAGSVYFANPGYGILYEWNPATSNLVTLPSQGMYFPYSLAVDRSGNIFMADPGYGAIQEWSAASRTVSLAANGGQNGVGVDGSGNLYFANNYGVEGEIYELQRAFVNPSAVSEPYTAGSGSMPAVFPATVSLTGPFAPASTQPWFTVTGVNNGVVSFSYMANTTGAPRSGVIDTLAGQTITVTQAAPPPAQLGTTNLLVGAAGAKGSDIVVSDPAAGTWTVTANAPWLHTLAGYQSGIGSTNVIFSFDSNPGAARSGAITIAGQTLTVTQAPTNYVAAGAVILDTNGVQSPYGTAMDSAGNIYWAGPGEVQEWIRTNDTVVTLVSNGLQNPISVAVDSANNVYIADSISNSVMKWTAANGNLTTLVASGLNSPNAVALDAAGNIYIADQGNNAIKEWLASSGNVVTLVSSGLNGPEGVAADLAGNVYIADSGNFDLKEWSPATGNVTILATSANGVFFPGNLAVDGSGNVFIGQPGAGDVLEWSPDGVVNVAAYVSSYGAAVDSSGNLFMLENSGDLGPSSVQELPRAFMLPTAKFEPFTGGNDSLSQVVPANILQSQGLYPTNDQPWVAITGVTNGVTSFSVAVNNTGAPRSANIFLLGNDVSINQNAVVLGTTNLLEGPVAGTDSITLAVSPPLILWSASANVGWLHPPVGYPTVAVPTNVIFTFDANPGATRTGTLTLGTTPMNITQAGVTYIAAPAPLTALVTNGLSAPANVAVDNSGYVYVANTGDQSMDEWVMASNSLEPIVFGSNIRPAGVAFNNAARIMIFSDTASNVVYAWAQGVGNTLLPYVTSGLNSPHSLAIDNSADFYIADTGNNAIEEFNPGTGSLVTLVSGLNGPEGVALDAFGDVYIADTGNNAIKEWFAANSNLVTIVSSGLNQPAGLAVDASGNIFIADTGDSAIKEWTAVNGTLTTLVGASVNHPTGVALDSADDLYIADTGNNAVEELPRAFVDPTSRLEPYAAGSDALPVILPASVNLLPPFAPAGSQSWLTVANTSGGIVDFAFTANPGPVRTAYINVLGESVSVTQTNSLVTPPHLTGAQVLGNGAFQFTFTNTPGTTFTVLATTNVALPLANWVNLGTVSNISPGIYQFASPLTNSQEFYEVIWP